MEKTTVILDASAFKESSCLLRLFYTAVLGYRGKINSNDIEFGSAFHLFRAIFREKGLEGLAEGVLAATRHFDTTPMTIKKNKQYLDRTFLQKCCVEYATKYEKDLFQVVRGDDGEALLELKFGIPYYDDGEVEILLAGTIDEVGKFVNGIYCISDCKTSSVWNIEDYFRSYQMSPQLIFYRWILKKYAELYPNSIFSEINRLDVGVFIDGVFYKGAAAEVNYCRSEVMLIKESWLEEFGVLVALKVQKLISAIKAWRSTQVLPLRDGMLNGSCNTVYGTCKFFTACAAQDDVVRKVVLTHHFVQKEYDPLSFGAAVTPK